MCLKFHFSDGLWCRCTSFWTRTLIWFARTFWTFSSRARIKWDTHTHTPAVLSPAPSIILHHVPQMVSSLFLKHLESLSQQRSNVRRTSTARRYQANTVSAKFQSSLQELVEKMERSARTSSYFILKAVKIRRQKSELFKKKSCTFLKSKKTMKAVFGSIKSQ